MTPEIIELVRRQLDLAYRMLGVLSAPSKLGSPGHRGSAGSAIRYSREHAPPTSRPEAIAIVAPLEAVPGAPVGIDGFLHRPQSAYDPLSRTNSEAGCCSF
jgi:hypothetical protein